MLAFNPIDQITILIDVLDFEHKTRIRSYQMDGARVCLIGEAVFRNKNFNDTIFTFKAEDMAKSAAEEATGLAVFAINLMNCKNIKYIPVDPNEALSRQVKRQMKRRNEEPYLTYEILEIQPIKPRTVKLTDEPNEKTDMRLHTVRGHFKTFTEDRPLFGKLTGTYWWGDCVKGNPELGAIDKDYRLLLRPQDLKMLTREGGLTCRY